MSLRDRLKKSIRRHKVKLTIGDAYVVAFNGRNRSSFFAKVQELKKKYTKDEDLNDHVNALTVAISLVDELGEHPYEMKDYKSIIEEMISSDIETVLVKSLDINGLSVESIPKHKKKSKKAAK